MTQPSLETDSLSSRIGVAADYPHETRIVLQRTNEGEIEPCETNDYDDSDSEAGEEDGCNGLTLPVPNFSGGITSSVTGSSEVTIAQNLNHIVGPVNIHYHNAVPEVIERQRTGAGTVNCNTPNDTNHTKNESNKSSNNNSYQKKNFIRKLLISQNNSRTKYAIICLTTVTLAFFISLCVTITQMNRTHTDEDNTINPTTLDPTIITTASSLSSSPLTSAVTTSTASPTEISTSPTPTITTTTTPTTTIPTTTASPAPEPNQRLNGYPLYNRTQWQAETPSKTGTVLGKLVPLVIIAHTNTYTCDGYSTCSQIVREIQMRDMVKKFDISYNFLVGEDGSIYEGRGWKLTNFYKANSLMFTFIGNFNKDELNKDMVGATKALLEYGTGMGSISSKIKEDYQLVGQNQTDNINYPDSPGENVCKEIQGWANYYNGTIYNY